MATITLRLDDAEAEKLRALAESEHRSVNGMLRAIIEQAVAGRALTKSERTRAAFDRIEKRDAVALDLLSR